MRTKLILTTLLLALSASNASPEPSPQRPTRTTESSTSPASTSSTSAPSSTDPSNLTIVLELLRKLPRCTIRCIAKGASDHGCQVTDVGCQCGKMAAIINTTAPCFVKAGCRLKDITDAAQAVLDVCEEHEGLNKTGGGNGSATSADGSATGGGTTVTVSTVSMVVVMAAVLWIAL